MTASSLEDEIRRTISLTGPMSVGQYMALCLTHPLHGYYLARDPFGARGDFTTAPEVSQMFGELLGLWAAAVWQQMGSPAKLRLIELGPGRGTLMRDALRAIQVAPDFRRAVELHLVEISPVLENMQRKILASAGVPVSWHRVLDDVPDDLPAIVLANEFIDALPVYQAVKQRDGWHQRVIGLGADGKLAFGLSPDPVVQFDRILPERLRGAPEQSVYEWRNGAAAREIGRRASLGGAALVIDYGHMRSGLGETLQAIGNHAFADPLSSPGQIDLTAHVDFEAFGAAAAASGARVHGPLEQGEFLRRLGIEARAAILKSSANAKKAAGIDAALARLTQRGEGGMGVLFKVMALGAPALGALPAF